MLETLNDPRLAVAAEIKSRLERDSVIARLDGPGIETRGAGPVVRGVAVSLESNSIELGLNLSLALVMEETLPTVAARIRAHCREIWSANGLSEDVEISMQILDFDD